MNDTTGHPDPEQSSPDVPPPRTPHVPTKWQRRFPNLLTFARLILAAAFFAALSMFTLYQISGHELSEAALFYSRHIALPLATILFITAAMTDALDGHLARKWNATSPLGRIMDPFADKVLILGAFVLFASPIFSIDFVSYAHPWYAAKNVTGFFPWMTIIILARELLVTSIRGAYESRGVDFAASTSGKVKMIVQSGGIALVLILLSLFETERVPFYPPPDARMNQLPPWVLHVMDINAWVITAVTVWSAVPYVSRAIKMRDALSDKG